jgi:hypothetical protein
VSTIDYFKGLIRPWRDVPEGAIHIFTTKRYADTHNDHQLDILDGSSRFYVASLPTNDAADVSGIDNVSFQSRLELKIAAPVMLLVGDSETRLLNGSIGKVLKFIYGHSRDGCMHVIGDIRGQGEFPLIHFNNGVTALVGMYTFDFGTCDQFKQIPLCLAWATTVHKSQGATFPCVAFHMEKVWCCNMVFSGCSRARSARGLFLIDSESDVYDFQRKCWNNHQYVSNWVRKKVPSWEDKKKRKRTAHEKIVKMECFVSIKIEK